MSTYEPTTGSIVHVEFYPDDHEAFQSFFETAFGWSFERDEEFAYTMWRAASPPFGGLGDPDDAPASPPSTLLYLAVEDLGSTVDAIEAAGGELFAEELEIPGQGAMAWFRAPGGVTEAIWEDRGETDPADGSPAFTDEPEPGSLVHFELYSDDPDATRTFHETVFGWTFEAMNDGGYTMARPPTPPAGGLLAPTDDMPVDIQTGTLLYLLVDSAAESCAAIEAAGASVLAGPFDVEGWGTMGVFESPGGVRCAVWEAAPASDDAGPAESEVAP